tara:strand:- start:878 stop:1036 length:159 start_codon:yes stop_codon:yes gene_type:complete
MRDFWQELLDVSRDTFSKETKAASEIQAKGLFFCNLSTYTIAITVIAKLSEI